MNLDVYHLDCMLQHNEREHLLGIEIREGVVLEWWCSVLVCAIVTDWVPKTWVLVLEISRPITCFCYVVTRDRTYLSIVRTRTNPTFWPFFVRTYLPTPTYLFSLMNITFIEKLPKTKKIFMFTTVPALRYRIWM